MLTDVAEKYFLADYNCAESIVHAGNEYYNLNLSDHDMRMTAGFGAGMQVGDICGALLGSICVISARYIAERAHLQKEELREYTGAVVKKFQNKFGARVCAQIKPKYYQKDIRCLRTVCIAAEVLEEVINEIDSNNNI